MKTAKIRTRHIPAICTETATAGELTVHFTPDSVPNATVIGYRGRSSEPAFYWAFDDRDAVQSMKLRIEEKLAQAQRDADEAAARRAARAAFDATAHIKAGDVVVNTWGFEQTNRDFYRVEKVGKKSLVLIRLETVVTSDGAQSMTGKAAPKQEAGQYAVKPGALPVRVATYPDSSGDLAVKFTYGSGKKWDGRPLSVSSYA